MFSSNTPNSKIDNDIINAIISGDISKFYTLVEPETITVAHIVELAMLTPRQKGDRQSIITRSPYMIAAAKGHYSVLHYLVWMSKRYNGSYILDLDAIDDDGMNALMFATIGGHADVVKLLLNVGCDPRIKCSRPDPLQPAISIIELAVKNGHASLVPLLESAINEKNATRRAMQANKIFAAYQAMDDAPHVTSSSKRRKK